MSKLLDYARLVRLPNVFTAMADIALCGFGLGLWPDHAGPILLTLLASSSLYLAGMVWNDYFDIDQDRRERPFRPLPSGRVSLRSARILGTVLTLAGLGFSALVGTRSLLIASLLTVAIFLYDRWLKRTWTGPIGMGSCRTLNILLGLSAGPGVIPGWGMWIAFVVGLYIVGVTWFARTEAHHSQAHLLKLAFALMTVAVLLALAVPYLAQEANARHEPTSWFPYLLVAFLFWIGRPAIKAIRVPEPKLVQKAVKRMVLGLVLLDAVLLTGLIGLWGLALAVLLVPGYVIGRWVYST